MPKRIGWIKIENKELKDESEALLKKRSEENLNKKFDENKVK